jgi:cellulose synthase/poly-beta-1,6-N-acetylglucosamine synthase-like glycosyltransferase
MITIYTNDNSFKRKLTVVAIWFIAIALTILLVEMVLHHNSPLLMKIIPIMFGLFMVAGILLRCKIARGMTLIVLYALALFPLISNFVTDSSFMMLSAGGNELFTSLEILVTNIIWALLFLIPIYFLSNNKSMEIFFIHHNPIEHLFFLVGGVLLVFAYIKLFL